MRARPNLLVFLVVVIGFAFGYAVGIYGYGIPVGIATVATLVQLAETKRRAREARLREAFDLCRWTLSEVADKTGLNIADLSRALSGRGKLDDWRLEMLGDEFRRIEALLELRDRGMPDLANAALRIFPVVQSMKVQA